jgi:predicted GIY-YIG superfamily endonuclease
MFEALMRDEEPLAKPHRRARPTHQTRQLGRDRVPASKDRIADRRTVLLSPPPAISLSGPVPLRRVRGFLIPDEPGVYLIHDLRGVLYAGRSICLRRRFAEHCEARGNELIGLAQRSVFGLLAFSWVIVPDRRRRAQLEHEFIAWLQPPCNSAVPGKPL